MRPENPTSPKETNTAAWWHKPFSNFQTNIQEVDATMDVEKVLDTIEEHGADTWLLNTGGIASFYPSDLPFQTRVPFLRDRPSGDLIGDAVKAAHKRGIKLLSRLDLSKVSARIAKEHPDWLFKSPTGERQVYNTLYTTCPSADYYQHRSLEIVDEIVERYPINGFFVNWFGFSEYDYSRKYHGVCHCDKCKSGFADFSDGKELPNSPEHPDYPEWLRFSTGVIRDLVARISKHILGKRPDVALILSRGAPVIYHEANNAFGRELWHHGTSESVSAYVTGMPDTAVMVNSVSFLDMPYRMAGEQPEHFAQYLLQAIARGGKPSTYIMGEPGRIPYANIPLAGEIQRFYSKNRTVYEQLRPGSTIALVRPDRLRSADEGYAETVSEFRGLYTALKEKHMPFDTIGAELISRMASEGNLARYSLVILPDIGELNAETAAALDDFVIAGGNVVLSGSSAIAHDGSVQLATAPSVMRVGRSKTGKDLWATYVTDAPQDAMDSFRYASSVVPVYGAYTSLVWKPLSHKTGTFLPQAPFGPPEKCYGHTGSDEPATVSLSSGGTVVQIPWTVGRSYHEFGITEVRDYFLNSIASVVNCTVTAQLPEQIEMIVSKTDRGLLVHLINQTGARRKSFGAHVPVSDGVIRVRGKKGRAKLLTSGLDAATTNDGDDLVIALPRLELYEVIHVELSE